MNSAILENSSVIVHGSMIGSHRWQKTVGNSRLFRFDAEVKSPTLYEQNITVLSIATLVQLAI